MVRIPGFHPGGPGSIPGVGTVFHLFTRKQAWYTKEIPGYTEGGLCTAKKGYEINLCQVHKHMF